MGYNVEISTLCYNTTTTPPLRTALFTSPLTKTISITASLYLYIKLNFSLFLFEICNDNDIGRQAVLILERENYSQHRVPASDDSYESKVTTSNSADNFVLLTKLHQNDR